jgi:uncharacterized protein YaiE (UPF0345 family)
MARRMVVKCRDRMTHGVEYSKD